MLTNDMLGVSCVFLAGKLQSFVIENGLSVVSCVR
jgi:hypothetical protein